MSQSGVLPKSAVAIEASELLSILSFALVFGRLAGANFASLQHLSRRLLMIQEAARKNPKSTDFHLLRRRFHGVRVFFGFKRPGPL